ncbi:MAG: serine protease [Bacteroidota bacterium]|nr:serine protease [Bacteroidota bacterium]
MILEINNLYEIVIEVNDGSGILLKFEADKKYYVLTAYHNIEESIENEDNIELFNDNNESYSIVGKPYVDKENDFALIEINSIKNIPIINYENNIKPDDLITFMGYPNKAKGDRKDLSGKVNEWNKSKTAIKVIEENIQGSFIDKEKTNEVIVGFSGSGVFKKDGEKLSLIGILKSLPEEDFDYKEISCVPIYKILQFIQNKNLAELFFSNPSAIAFDNIKPTDKRNLEDKLKVCSTLRSAKVKQYIRTVSLGKSEFLQYDERQLSSVKNFIFEKCQDELMTFIDNFPNDNELTNEDIKNLLEQYAKRAKEIIDDKRDENNYPNFSDDIIEKIILDLIDTCHLSFDEEGIYEGD